MVDSDSGGDDGGEVSWNQFPEDTEGGCIQKKRKKMYIILRRNTLKYINILSIFCQVSSAFVHYFIMMVKSIAPKTSSLLQEITS